MEYLVDQELQASMSARHIMAVENVEMKTAINSIYALVRPCIAPVVDEPLGHEGSRTAMHTVELNVKDPASSAAFLCEVLTLPKALVSADNRSAIVQMKNMRLELLADAAEDEPELPREHNIKFKTTISNIEFARKALAARNSLWGFMKPRGQHVVEFLDLDGYHWEATEIKGNDFRPADTPPVLEQQVYQLKVEDFSVVPEEKKDPKDKEYDVADY